MLNCVVTFDFETDVITDTDQFPLAVCMSYAVIRPSAVTATGYCVAERSVVEAKQGIALLHHWAQQGASLTGANTAFDVLVACYNSADVEQAVAFWAWLYDAGRVTDILIRQALLDGAVDAKDRLPVYSAASVVERWTGVKLDKKNPWRTKFIELLGVPPEQYPPDAYGYSLEDAIHPAEVWIQQEAARRPGSWWRRYFPACDPLLNQHAQCWGALALKDLESVGLHANADSVRRLREHYEHRAAELRETLMATVVDPRYPEHRTAYETATRVAVKDDEGNVIGFEPGKKLEKPLPVVRKVYSKNTDAIAARFAALGKQLDKTPTGKWSIKKADLLASPDPQLRALADWPQSKTYLEGTELVNVEYRKSEAAAKAVMLLTRWAQGEEVARTASGGVALDGDACEKSKNPALSAYAEYTSAIKTLGTDLPILERATKAPFHAHYNVLIASGRTATGSDKGEGTPGNVQNMPRKPGIRECYVPPPGYVFVEADWSAVELCTFGQICLWVLGWSECARMINAGIDQHSVIAAGIRGHFGEDAWKAVKQAIEDGDKRADEDRTAGKGVNFGRKAMMSAKTFVGYAWTNYRLEIDEEGASKLIALHDYIIKEMQPYSRWAQSHARNPSDMWNTRFDLVHPWSGRLRADIGFTDAHNYPFQGLASDLAKRALVMLFKARWGLSELGTADPLYRCLPCLFVHDSITAAVLEENAHEAAERLGELMTEASRQVTPDCVSIAEPQAMRQLSKKAKPRFVCPNGHRSGKSTCKTCGEPGRHVPWDVWEEARLDLTNCPPDKSPREYLTARQWPPYVIDDVCSSC